MTTCLRCGGCGDTIRIGAVRVSDDAAAHIARAFAPHDSPEVVAFSVACPEPICNAVVVRCVRCGGERAARAALAHHTCRAVLA